MLSGYLGFVERVFIDERGFMDTKTPCFLSWICSKISYSWLASYHLIFPSMLISSRMDLAIVNFFSTGLV